MQFSLWGAHKVIKTITTADQARQYAIDWQAWASNQSLSWGELAEWSAHFEILAEKFDLLQEFKENAII